MSYSNLLLALIQIASFSCSATGFVCPIPSGRSGSFVCTPSFFSLFGLSEWREDTSFNDDNEGLFLDSDCRRHTVPLHLVSSDQVALPGEIKYFQFRTQAELKLFQQAMDCHHGIFGLGLCMKQEDHQQLECSLAERRPEDQEVLLDRFPLMEIIDYKNMNLGVDLGIFCSAQVVGRAQFVSYQLQDDSERDTSQSAMALCTELLDEAETHYSLEEVNVMAREVVETIGRITNHEYIYLDRNDETRSDRFLLALQAAFQTDSQGYVVPNKVSPSVRSWKELNAISWAAFGASVHLPIEETYRLHALNMPRMTTRIQLASFWLADKLAEVETLQRKSN